MPVGGMEKLLIAKLVESDNIMLSSCVRDINECGCECHDFKAGSHFSLGVRHITNCCFTCPICGKDKIRNMEYHYKKSPHCKIFPASKE